MKTHTHAYTGAFLRLIYVVVWCGLGSSTTAPSWWKGPESLSCSAQSHSGAEVLEDSWRGAGLRCTLESWTSWAQDWVKQRNKGTASRKGGQAGQKQSSLPHIRILGWHRRVGPRFRVDLPNSHHLIKKIAAQGCSAIWVPLSSRCCHTDSQD